MNDKIAAILARASMARYVAELFAEPDDAGRARLLDKSTREHLKQAALLLDLPLSSIDQLAAGLPPVESLLEIRSRLFGHAVRSACPPYELEYHKGEIFQQSQGLADITAFYRAFGLEVSGDCLERPDHIAAEWEFLGVAAWKEGMATAEGADQSAETCRRAQRDFLREHAAAWMPAFFHRLRRVQPRNIYYEAAALGERLLRCWCQAFDVPPGEEELELRTAGDEDMEIQCGDAAGPRPAELGPRLAAAVAGRA